jgi:hypothetical protein
MAKKKKKNAGKSNGGSKASAPRKTKRIVGRPSYSRLTNGLPFEMDPYRGSGINMRGSRLENGNLVNYIEMSALAPLTPDDGVGTVSNTIRTCDVLGNVSTSGNLQSLCHMNITPNLFPFITNFMSSTPGTYAPFDRVQLHRLRIIYRPIQHRATAGEIAGYIEYAGSHGIVRTSASLSDAGMAMVRRQPRNHVGPLYEPFVLEWHPQDTIDEMYSRLPAHFRPVDIGGAQIDHQFVVMCNYTDTASTTIPAGEFVVQAIVKFTGAA